MEWLRALRRSRCRQPLEVALQQEAELKRQELRQSSFQHRDGAAALQAQIVRERIGPERAVRAPWLLGSG